MAKYTKFIVALLGAVATTVTTQFPSTDHWLPAVVSAVAAILVYLAPNKAA